MSVDAGNYVSLRAFLGQLGDKLQDRFVDDSGDGDLPSVEQFLDRLRAQRCVGFFLFLGRLCVWLIVVGGILIPSL